MDCMQILDIAARNDTFRRSGFGVTVTPGIQNLPDMDGLLGKVRDDDRFTEDNDPYGEHDFGSVTWYGEKVFWKIDYYDRTLRIWEDPKSESCKRVLTLMLAEEY